LCQIAVAQHGCIFAPIGDLAPVALAAVRKGGRVVCADIHMSDIPPFAYSLL
jgi:propanol-preferring alcohol dehydrogenase